MTLTREQLQDLPNAELDAVVAKSFGWFQKGVGSDWFDSGGRRIGPSDWSPSDDWSAMGEVITVMESKGFYFEMSCKDDRGQKFSSAAFVLHDDEPSEVCVVESNDVMGSAYLPRAVAIAAVLAVQEMK